MICKTCVGFEFKFAKTIDMGAKRESSTSKRSGPCALSRGGGICIIDREDMPSVPCSYSYIAGHTAKTAEASMGMEKGCGDQGLTQNQ